MESVSICVSMDEVERRELESRSCFFHLPVSLRLIGQYLWSVGCVVSY